MRSGIWKFINPPEAHQFWEISAGLCSCFCFGLFFHWSITCNTGIIRNTENPKKYDPSLILMQESRLPFLLTQKYQKIPILVSHRGGAWVNPLHQACLLVPDLPNGLCLPVSQSCASCTSCLPPFSGMLLHVPACCHERTVLWCWLEMQY